MIYSTGKNLSIYWLVAVALCLSGELCLAQSRQATPAVERITDSLYRIGKALVDTKTRTIVCPAQVNMDNGSIEYLAVAPGGKTHESLLLVDVRPLHLQLALLLLGLEPKNVLTRQGEKTTPKGAPVDLFARWRDTQGNLHEAHVEEWVMDTSGRPMPTHTWVFTGSRIIPQGFEADLEKSLVAVWHDPAAILDNPLSGGAINAYIVNTKRVLKRATSIELIIKAAEPAKTAPSK